MNTVHVESFTFPNNIMVGDLVTGLNGTEHVYIVACINSTVTLIGLKDGNRFCDSITNLAEVRRVVSTHYKNHSNVRVLKNVTITIK